MKHREAMHLRCGFCAKVCRVLAKRPTVLAIEGHVRKTISRGTTSARRNRWMSLSQLSHNLTSLPHYCFSRRVLMETSRVFVKGLPPTLSEVDFKAHFSRRHAVTDVKLMPQRRIGYVGYKTAQDAQAAVKYFNKSFLRMSKLHVEPAFAVSSPP